MMTQHDSRVFILGAGFSQFAGHPLLGEFGSVVLELATDPESRLRPDERARFTNIVNYRHEMQQIDSYLNLDINNLEHLFSMVDMASSLDSEDAVRAKDLRNDLVFVLVKTLELTRRVGGQLKQDPIAGGDVTRLRDIRSKDQYFQPYHTFAKGLRPHDVCVSFNYDTLLEDALLSTDRAPDYGIQDANPEYDRVSEAVRVLKLHGSVNFVEYSAGDMKIINHEVLDAPTDAYYRDGQPLLVPPTWNKGSLEPPLQQVWGRAAESIADASRLIFIGYSLPDTDLSFRYLLANSLVKNRQLRSIRVFDPADPTLDRYKAFASETLRNRGQFEGNPRHFEDVASYNFM